MALVTRLGAVLLLAAAAGCTAATSAGGPGAGFAAVAAPVSGPTGGVVADVGNGRPLVTHDGLMVRRRVVIAFRTTAGADLAAVRRELDRVAAARHTPLSDISPSVLEPADLERLEPEVTVVLPAGSTPADAATLVAAAGSAPAVVAGVEDSEVVKVLVHDLRFRTATADPTRLAAAIEREGILADALGRYSTSARSGRLDVTYTGPLLSDDLVAQVRDGIARGAGTAPGAVSVLPRSSAGVGVVLGDEPAPAPVVEVAPHQGGHGHATALAATTREPRPSSPSNLWVVLALAAVGVAGAVRLGVGLVRSAEGEAEEREESEASGGSGEGGETLEPAVSS